MTMARTPASAGFPEASTVRIRTTDGEQLVAWFAPPKEGKPIVLFFHGNAEVLAWRAKRFKALTEDGIGLLAVAFRGYAGSTGKPTEAGLIADGEAAYRFTTARYSAKQIVVWAIRSAAGSRCGLPPRIRSQGSCWKRPTLRRWMWPKGAFPSLPVRWLMLAQFPSIDHIKDVHAPLLILHGEQDRVVPIAFGEKLFAAANEPKRLVRFPEGEHINLDQFGAVEIVRRFLSE